MLLSELSVVRNTNIFLGITAIDCLQFELFNYVIIYLNYLVSEINIASGKSNELVPRRVGEAIGSTVGTLATIVNYPIGNLRLIWHASYC